jgi:hypothetical protein
MSHPTFEEAVRLWTHLSDGDQPESAREDSLYEACEKVILLRELTSPQDAVIVCQVLLDNLRSGQRSDELDVQALASLRDWLGRLTTSEGLARSSLLRSGEN